MSMKSSGPSPASWSRCDSSGIPSTGGRAGALSTTATISTRSRTPAAESSAGRCDWRAMPPAPMTAPRYRGTSGDADVGMALVLEEVGERGGVPFVHQQQHNQQQAHRHRFSPEKKSVV